MDDGIQLSVQVFGNKTKALSLQNPSINEKKRPWLIYIILITSITCISMGWMQTRENLLWIGFALFCFFYFQYRSFLTTIIEESVIVMPEIGVQLQKTRRNGNKTIQFIDAQDIDAVIMNEAIHFSDVIYYIAFVTRSNKKTMTIAFEHFRPKIPILKQLYHEIREGLFPSDGPKQMRFSPAMAG